MKSGFYKFFRPLFAWFFRIIFLVVPKHADNEPRPEEGPYILCANHISAVDPILICDTVRHQQPRFMAKKELFSVPVLGKLIGALGAFPVDRAGKDAGVLVRTVKMLENGCCVGLFPQGTRRPGTDPAETPVRNGVGLICARSHATVLPVHIRPKGYRMRFLRPVKVIVGKPISYEEYTEDGAYASDYAHITKYIFDRICELGKDEK